MLARRISNRGQQQKGPFSSSPFLPPRAPKWGEMCGEGKERHRRLHSERSHFLAASALRRRRILKGIQEKARGRRKGGGIALSRRGRALGRRGRREREIEAEDGRTDGAAAAAATALIAASNPLSARLCWLESATGWGKWSGGRRARTAAGIGPRRAPLTFLCNFRCCWPLEAEAEAGGRPLPLAFPSSTFPQLFPVRRL